MKLIFASVVYLFAICILDEVQSYQSCLPFLKAMKHLVCDCKKTCEAGWMEYRNHCYYFSVDKLNWFESEQFCKDHGSYLAKVEDHDENQWIVSKAHQDGAMEHLLYLGGNDIKKEGEWIWSVDSSSLSYQNWNQRYQEPNGGTTENCLNLMNNGKWNDYQCHISLRYVCKKQKI